MDHKIDVHTYTRFVNGKAVLVQQHQSSHKVSEHPGLFGAHHEKKEKKPWTGPIHPQPNDIGAPVPIYKTSTPTDPESWMDPEAISTFTPGGDAPRILNGVPMKSWSDAPDTPEGWNEERTMYPPFAEPEFPESNKDYSAGVVIEEPDGRVWVVHPTNEFGGYKATFPKGRIEDGITPQASAMKEAFEESGLRVQIVGYLCDVERTTTMSRYYLAKRVGGTPKDAGWESQAVSLAPRSKLYELLNQPVDWPMAEKLGAGPMPPAPESKWKTKPSKFSDPGPAEDVPSAIDKAIGKLQEEWDIWDAKNYKSSSKTIELSGDGPKSSGLMSVSAINEGKKKNALSAISARINALKGAKAAYEKDPDIFTHKVYAALEKAPLYFEFKDDRTLDERRDAAVAKEILNDPFLHFGSKSAARAVWTAIGLPPEPAAIKTKPSENPNDISDIFSSLF